jgi:uncharacterized protein (TIGR03000 family)
MKRNLWFFGVAGVAAGVVMVLAGSTALAGGRTGQQPHFPRASSETLVEPSPFFGYESTYQGPEGPMAAARLRIRLPENARLWIEGQPMPQRGAERVYATPQLRLDQDYVYHLKAEWTDNGQPVTRTREFTIHAGDLVNIRFGSER